MGIAIFTSQHRHLLAPEDFPVDPTTLDDLPEFSKFKVVFQLPFDALPSNEYSLLASPDRSNIVNRKINENIEKLAEQRSRGTLEFNEFDHESVRYSFKLISGGFPPMTPAGLWSLGFRIHNIYCREFVTALASYLKDRIAFYGATAGPVVEVGAGFGVLSEFLRLGGIPIIASSLSDLWPNHLGLGLHPRGVKEQDQYETVKESQPSIIICAWMPDEQDWTASWREVASVREYILIGAPPSSLNPSCGTAEAWCMRDEHGQDGEPVIRTAHPQGWTAMGLPEVSRWCLCYADGDLPFSLSNVLVVRRDA